MQNNRLSKLLEFLTNDSSDPFILYAIATEYNVINDKKNAFHYYLRLVDEKAIETYQNGMVRARSKKDMHSFSELQGAYHSAAGFDYEDD